jgi:hypothetical protein
MFKHWIGSSKMQVVVEITGKTVDVLSANRDGFAYTVGQSFQELIYELSVDKKTFDRASVERQVIFLGKPKPPVLEAVAARGTGSRDTHGNNEADCSHSCTGTDLQGWQEAGDHRHDDRIQLGRLRG